MVRHSLSKKQIKAMRIIRNSLIHKGRSPSVRELMGALGYRSPRSAAMIVEKLIEERFLRRKRNGCLQIIRDFKDDEMHAQTIDVPLVGTVACGIPILAEENVEAIVPVSKRLARMPYRYFLLRAQGDSMDKKGIDNGDLVLVRQQQVAENGDTVVALIDGEATIKEIQVSKDAVILKPKSTNRAHKPIIVSSDFRIQGIVVASIPAEHIEY